MRPIYGYCDRGADRCHIFHGTNHEQTSSCVNWREALHLNAPSPAASNRGGS